jgi:DNA-damage-inducible protein J
MAANALVQARIDAGVKARAAAVLENMGLTVSDVVRILLTRVANEGGLPFDFATDPEAHDRWFRAKVIEALEDTNPTFTHDEVEAHFSRRREAALKKAAAGSP